MIALPEFWGKWLLPRSFRTDTELLHWRSLQHTLLGRFDWLIRSHSQFNNQGTLTSIENHSVVFYCNCDNRFRPVISTCTVELLHISIKYIKILRFLITSDPTWRVRSPLGCRTTPIGGGRFWSNLTHHICRTATACHSKLRTQGLNPFDSHTVHFSAILLQRSAPILESAKQIFARFALTPSENTLLICRVLLLDDKHRWNSWVCWVPYEVGAVLTSSKRSWTKRPCLHVFSSAFLSVGFPACILSLVW